MASESARPVPLQLTHGWAAPARWPRRYAELLVQASRRLASSLDYDATLHCAAHLALPDLADWCVVYIVDGARPVPQLVAAHVNPTTEQALVELYSRHRSDLPARHPLAQVVRTATPLLLSGSRMDRLRVAPLGAMDPPVSGTIGGRSAIVVPLATRGQPFGAMALGSDRSYARTQRAVAETLASLGALALEQSRLDRASHERLATAAHDLKDPLTFIRGLAQILQRKIAVASGPPAEELRQGLAQIDAATLRMAGMLDQLLATSPSDPGEPPELHRQAADLAALVRRSVAERRQLTQRHVIAVDAPPSLVGQWDAGGLERVLANLLSNAIKYSPTGGTINVSLVEEDDTGGRWAVLSVHDDGLGIPAADLPHVFEPFHRGRNVSCRIAGHGLGLAGVRQIVDQHRGSISVHSREGAGTTIVVRLPFSPDHSV